MDIEPPEDPAIPLLSICPEDAPTCNKNTCSTRFIAAIFILARSWKEPKWAHFFKCHISFIVLQTGHEEYTKTIKLKGLVYIDLCP